MTHWLDFSGAPPLLIPSRLVRQWHGALVPGSDQYCDLNKEFPRTDYDRACNAAWPGRGVIEVGDSSALVLYTEFDEQAWDPERKLIASGGWWPTADQLSGAIWTDPLTWEALDNKFVLMNSAASGARGLRGDDWTPVSLVRGTYVIEYAYIAAQYVGIFHRFTLASGSRSAA